MMNVATAFAATASLTQTRTNSRRRRFLRLGTLLCAVNVAAILRRSEKK
jgi:hypothetical protein